MLLLCVLPKTALIWQGIDNTRPLKVFCSTNTWPADPLRTSCKWHSRATWRPDLVVPTQTTDAGLDLCIENLEAKATPGTLPHVSQTILEQSVQYGIIHYPAKRRHCHWKMPLPWKMCLVCSDVQVSGTCQSLIHMYGWIQEGQCPKHHLPPPTCFCFMVHPDANTSPVKWCTHTQWST